MSRVAWSGKRIALTLLAAAFVAGCVVPGDVGVGLIVSPNALDFGLNGQTRAFTVAKTVTVSLSGPVVVSTNEPWIVLDNCTNVLDGCSLPSIGGALSVAVPVRVDRNKTGLGTNRGTIFIDAGGAARQFVEVTADDALVADFSVDEAHPDVNSAISFADLSLTSDAGGVTTWEWNFGDGTTSTAQNPVHAYTSAGLFNVSLKVTTGERSETQTKPAFIVSGGGSADVDFRASSTNVYERENVTFTDLSRVTAAPTASHLWDFGDGKTSVEVNPIHAYDVPGVYSVTLTITTAVKDGEVQTVTATKKDYVVVKRRVPPTADFTLSQVTPYVNVPVNFVDLSLPGTAPIGSRVWEFGDGQISVDAAPTHVYTSVGEFTAKLTVTSPHGLATKSRTFTVEYKPPTADFVAVKTNPTTGEAVQFVDKSVPGTNLIVKWEWDFGDGGTSRLQNPTHIYAKRGTYTVSLTVTTDNPSRASDTKKATDYIRVFDPPIPGFTFAPQSVFVNDTVQFTNTSKPSLDEPSVTYLWDFDGSPTPATDTSVQLNPTNKFTKAGTYGVTLKVITPTRSVTSAPKNVVVDTPPNPEFSASTVTPTTQTNVTFTDTTNTAQTRPIASRSWDFGDGTTSTAQTPVHRYTTVGKYTVKLTVSYTHSATGATFQQVETKTNYINVQNPVPPTARIDIDNGCAMQGIAVNFADDSTAGSGPITNWQWVFGDGQTSTLQNPAHTYTRAGTYVVTLTVKAGSIAPPFDTHEVTRTISVSGASPTALDRYVRTPDPNYSYTPLDSFRTSVQGFSLPATAFTLTMTSQSWRNATQIYKASERLWTHNLTIVAPDAGSRITDTAMIFVSGGSRDTEPFTANTLPVALSELAVASGSVIAFIDNVPSQPITFGDEEGLRSRSEDAIIAYSYAEYLDNFGTAQLDETWPVLLPMVKAVVRAMDTVQDFLPTVNHSAVDSFIVSGGSKRGWTTWLTGATDCRVKAIAPIVIDVLHMDLQMLHHRKVYGYWAPSIYEYAQEKVFDRLLPEAGTDTLSPEAVALLKIVDPYSYRTRMATMPKFLMNSTGDEFFVPDSAQWYFSDLPGEKRIDYVPNTSHQVGDFDAADPTDDPALQNLFAWYLAVTQDIARPNFTWNIDRTTGTIIVTPDSTAPKSVQLWQATNPNGRDFRKDTIGEAWVSTSLTRQANGTFTAQVAIPATGYTGFFVQMTYTNPATFATNLPGFSVPDLVFTTPITVVPDVYPVFESFRTNAGGIPMVVLYGTPQEMGEDYGRLMAPEINAFLPALVASSIADGATLDTAWGKQAGAMDNRIFTEVSGIATGAGLSATTVKRAQMVPVLERLSTGSSAAIWNDGVAPGQGVLQATTVNGDLNRGLQNQPCIVVYIPGIGYGVPHAMVTFAGLVTGYAGVNLGGIAASAIDEGAGASNLEDGRLHYLGAMRRVLYDATSLRDAWGAATKRQATKDGTLIITDGRNEGRGSKVLLHADLAASINLDDDDVLDPVKPNVLPDAVYGGENAGGLFNFLGNFLGGINVSGVGNNASLQTMDRQVATTGQNILNVAIDATSLDVFAAYGVGTQDASTQNYVQVNIQGLLP